MRLEILLLILLAGCLSPPSGDEFLLSKCTAYRTTLLRDDCLKNTAPLLVGNYTAKAIETCGTINITLFRDSCFRQVADVVAGNDTEMALGICGRISYQNHSLACERSVRTIADGSG